MSAGDLYFDPWIGARYRDWPADIAAAPVYPIHILGESHYGEAHEYRPSFTREVIASRALRPSPGPFFQNLTKLVTFSAAQPDRANVWDTLAFSNYIQDFLPGPRLPPSAAMWERGHRAFRELLNRYQPDAILVLGQRLWNGMIKNDSFRLAPKHADGVTVDDARVYEHKVAGQRRWTLAMHVLHPSAGGGHFKLAVAQQRLRLFHEYLNNIDTRGTFEPNDAARRAQIEVPDA